MLPTPAYDRDGITLYHGDCLDLLPHLPAPDVIVTDPPYGIAYQSGKTGHDGGVALPGIVGDDDTSLRDAVLAMYPIVPAVVFGTWKVAKPAGCKAVLTWEKGSHVGMGDLSMPWKPNTEEIYILGSGFRGHRGSAVLSHPADVSWNSTRHGRKHPHQKPLALMLDLLKKCPPGWVLDPFAGSGTTGVACAKSGRRCILIEKDARYIPTIIRRLRECETPLFANAD
jgi:DNA modification methylase